MPTHRRALPLRKQRASTQRLPRKTSAPTRSSPRSSASATSATSIAAAPSATGGAAAAASSAGDADDHGEDRVGALVVRGNRCVLARCTREGKAKRWVGMRVPSVEGPTEGEDATAAARRAIEAHLEIDVADQLHQMGPLAAVPPIALYRASGGLTTVVFFVALEVGLK
jgi:hypothetical protein